MNIFTRLFPVLALIVIGSVSAEEHPYVPFEAAQLKIKLSDDGTGIVKGVSCMTCDFSVVNITENTKAYASGAEVSIFEARKRANKYATVSFNPETREVLTIRWSK